MQWGHMRKIAFLMAAFVGLTVTSRASAESCADLDDEPGADAIKKIYVENGDTQEFMIRALGRQLIASSAGKLRVIYRNRPTCDIRKDMFGTSAAGPVKMISVAGRPVRYIKVTQPAAETDPVAFGECTVPDTDPTANVIQLGIGATYLSSCTDTVATNAALGVYDGPIQAYGFITHPSSQQNAIAAQEGYLAFAFPEAGGDAQPWTVQDLRFKRSNTASTTLTMSAAVRLTPAQFSVGARLTALAPESSDELKKQVHNSVNPEATLGILGLDLYDTDRTFVKLLPFRSWDQRFAYYPDKTKDTFDKQNVRDGHYVPWAPTPYMAIKDGNGDIADVDAKRFYDLVRGFRKDADVDGLRTIAQNSLIPECAMTVTRKGDGADLEPYTDPASCSCYYEKNVKNGATTCATCTGADNSTCGTNGKCRLGYCQEQ